MQDLTGLVALLAVAERRSFTAAAKALRVTPSAVSQTVKSLEERIGVRLVARTTRSVGLTEAGERFVARLRPAMADIDRAFESLAELRDRPAGLLRLSVSRVALRAVLEPLLAQFLDAYPEIQLDVSVDDALVDIVARGFDAGIRLGETLEREMIAVRLGGDERVAIVGSPSYFAARGRPKHPRDLHAHDCINYRQIARGAVYRWELTVDRKDVEIAVEGRLLANDADVMLRGALDGIGLAYLLESTVREHLASGRLVRVLEAHCVPFPGLHLYYPARAASPKLKAFVDFVRKRLVPRAAHRDRPAPARGDESTPSRKNRHGARPAEAPRRRR